MKAKIEIIDEYDPIAPSDEAATNDAAVVARMRCSKCGGKMQYEPYYNKDIGSYIAYIALAVCEKCGREVSF